MSTYSVLIFTDSVHKQYMTEQQKAIDNAISKVTSELVNHTDSRHAHFSTKQRVPCVMIFKDGARMQAKHSKISHDEMINWIKGVVGTS